MSDTQSQKSSNTNKTSRHRVKICAYDGKPEGPNYVWHAKVHHGGIPKEWVEGEPLLDEPWCSNWKEIIADKTKKVEPMNVLLKF